MTDPNSAPCARETILLVEDEQSVRTLAVRVLRRKGFNVIEAVDGQDGLRVASATSDPIALLITDLIMPGLDGPQLASRLVPARPAMRVLFMSGYMEEDVRGRPDVNNAEFLGKPFLPEDLVRKVESMLVLPTPAVSGNAA